MTNYSKPGKPFLCVLHQGGKLLRVLRLTRSRHGVSNLSNLLQYAVRGIPLGCVFALLAVGLT